jgi:hypothetical protein
VLEYQETIRLKPDYSAAHRGVGRALEKGGRLAEAEGAYAAGPRRHGTNRRFPDEEGIEVF